MTSSFVVITHLLITPNTSHLLYNLIPAIVLTYGVIKRMVSLRKKEKEKRDLNAGKVKGDHSETSSPSSEQETA